VLRAIELIARWDNTTGIDARGAMLFQMWFDRYLLMTPNATSSSERWDRAFAVPWTPAEPVSTPRGLADPERAVAAFVWAIEETAAQYGSWDVSWGEVHRVRHGGLDLPVGGCSGAYGCFRTLGFRRAADGKRVVSRGDGWVFAVEFADVPKAYSVLAYGQSSREDSPHHSDQVLMFTEGRMKAVAFTPEEIAAALIRRYRPGREPGIAR
jgi:acyl-homoserine-lactone acylase